MEGAGRGHGGNGLGEDKLNLKTHILNMDSNRSPSGKSFDVVIGLLHDFGKYLTLS